MASTVWVDLEKDPDRAASLCMAGHQRLLADVAELSNDQVLAASRLPGWSVGHVLTHLARNADAHARRLDGALRGEEVPKYPGGAAQRVRDVDEGARRPTRAIIEDLQSSQARLEDSFSRSAIAGWPNRHFRGDSSYGPHSCPAHRLREVEMHHVDMGAGYEPREWPEEYVAWDLRVLLATVPERLSSLEQQRLVMAWLAGRGPPASFCCAGALGLTGCRDEVSRTTERFRARVSSSTSQRRRRQSKLSHALSLTRARATSI